MLSAVTRRVGSAVSTRFTAIRAMTSGQWGEGAGHGGGSGGSIRDAGGSFGKREVAEEERYFRKVQAEQLSSMKHHVESEIKMHEQSIRLHQEAIERHKAELARVKEEKEGK